MPKGTADYARSSREPTWGLAISVPFSEKKIDGLVTQPWGWSGGSEDLGMTMDFDLWQQTHRPIPLRDPNGLSPIDRRSVIP